MKRFMLLTMLAVSTAAAQIPEKRVSLRPYGAIEAYRWEEVDEQGQVLLQEAGPRYSIGIIAHFLLVPGSPMFADMDVRYTFGLVAYDGALVSPEGESIPYSTKTAYSAFEGSMVFGYPFRVSRQFQISPLAGVIFEYWVRNLDYGGPHGYTEHYLAGFAGFGIRFTYAPSNVLQIFANASMSAPLVVTESFTVARPAQVPIEVVLHPGSKPRYRVEVGGNIHRFSVIACFDALSITRTDDTHLYYQPDSNRRELSLRLCYAIALL